MHGGIWKVNWLSELYSCTHHNFASRITQTLAVVEPMFCHLLGWCISGWSLNIPSCAATNECACPPSVPWMTSVGTRMQHSAPPESPVLVSLGVRAAGSLLGNSQDPAHQEHSVWANMQILGSANTNTVNYTQQKHTQQPGSHMIDIMLWLCCGTFIFIGKHFRQQFRFT